MNLDDLSVSPETAALIVVDWQERLEPAMEEARQDLARRNATLLLEAARLTGLPVLATEQYPKGLGPTIPALKELFQGLHPRHPEIAKTCFAATDSNFFMHQLESLRRRVAVLIGMETHVCVWQTARALRAAGWSVHVPADAVLSRTVENREIGLSLMRQAGCVITSSEAVAFDLVRGADHPAFKAISKLVR